MDESPNPPDPIDASAADNAVAAITHADDQTLYERIWLAQRDGQVVIGTDLKVLNHPNSPVFKRSDNLLPWVAAIFLAIAGYRIAGWIGLIAVSAGMAVLMMTTISFAVLSRVRTRAVDYALSGREGFEALWSYGGLSLKLTNDSASEIKSPMGDWRAFARQRLPKADSELEG